MLLIRIWCFMFLLFCIFSKCRLWMCIHDSLAITLVESWSPIFGDLFALSLFWWSMSSVFSFNLDRAHVEMFHSTTWCCICKYYWIFSASTNAPLSPFEFLLNYFWILFVLYTTPGFVLFSKTSFGMTGTICSGGIVWSFADTSSF